MQDLFEELKRRKVFRVAAVYAVVAWLLIQVAATIMPALQMPDWTVSFVTILFILGFPIALVLSWAYDITPEGIKEDAATQSPPVAAPPSDRKLIYATFVLVLLVAGFQIADRFVFPSSETASTNSPSIDSPNSLLAVRSSLNLGQQEDVMFGQRMFNAISPDGARVAYIVNQSDGPHLYLRELNQLLPRDLGRLNREEAEINKWKWEKEWDRNSEVQKERAGRIIPRRPLCGLLGDTNPSLRMNPLLIDTEGVWRCHAH
jgi:hypothetical protein